MEQDKRVHLVMVCGPNGAGKSTFTSNSNTNKPVVDADKVAKDSGLGPIDAGKKVYSQIKEYLDNKQSFVRESTLTSKFDFKLMEQAKQQGYHVSMVYVGLESVQYSLDRVAHRHALGGHDVPKEDLIRRYSRSMENLPRAIKLADQVTIYDNTGKTRTEVAFFEKGALKNEYSTPNWYLEVKKNWENRKKKT